jgi:hypothetical protein
MTANLFNATQKTVATIKRHICWYQHNRSRTLQALFNNTEKIFDHNVTVETLD